MIRAFYTNPIAVAWMTAMHGMTIIDKNGDVVGVGVLQWEARNDAPQERYYIHPDSTHLLSARIGDIVIVSGCLERVDLTPNEDDISQIERIILRNSLAFHWPEFEGAE